jgi:hypothetical protein
MVEYKMDALGRIEHEVYPQESPMGKIEAALRARRPEVVRALSSDANTRQALYDFRHGFSIFLSHASEDKPKAIELFDHLVADGYDPWLDIRKILPGQHWRREIKRAQQKTDVGLICCSTISVNKTGIVQVEIKDFLELAKMRPSDHIYLVPVRLEQCDLPDELLEYQYVDLYTAKGYERLAEALDYEALKIADQRARSKS